MGEEVTITYETLYELYRREKDRAELQELPASFFSDVAGYLAEKEAAVRPAQGSIFDNEAEKARIQADNVRKILKALYDRRESKILDMAMVKARTQGIVNTQPLLDPEKDLYTSVVGILNMYRGGVLQNLMMGSTVRAPQRKPQDHLLPEREATTPSATLTGVPSMHLFSPPAQPSKEAPCSPMDQKQQAPWSAMEQNVAPIVSDPCIELPAAESKTVRFLCAVPKFVGPNLEVYGPFSENDTAMLPEPIVNVLLSKGRVEMQKTSSS